MEFPISIISDFLTERGYSLAYQPINYKTPFKWVSASENARKGKAEDTLFVLSNINQVIPGRPAVVLSSKGVITTVHPNMIILEDADTTPEELADEIQRYLVSIYEWVDEMHTLLAEGCECEALLKSSEPILKNYISVTDSVFRLIASTPGIPPIDPESQYLVEHGRYRNEMIEKAQHSDMAENWQKKKPVIVYESNVINQFPSIEHIYHLENQYAAHLLMVCPKPITYGQAFLFSLLEKSVDSFLEYQWAHTNPIRQPYTAFLGSLIRQDGVKRETVESQARYLDIPTSGVFKVLAISNAWAGGSSTYYAARIMRTVSNCWVLVEDDVLIVIVHVSNSVKLSTGEKRLANTEDQVFDLVKGLHSQVGVSQKFFHLQDLASAAYEARIALRYGKVCYRHFLKPGQTGADDPISYIFRFKRFFPFFACDPDGDLNRFLRKNNITDRIFGEIDRADEANGTVDGYILRGYLKFGGKVSRICNHLGLHRNSVLYRIKHIEETYHLDLNDPDERSFLLTLMHLPM